MKRKSRYSEETIKLARSFYLKRWTPKEIAEELKLNSVRVVYSWAEKYKWRELLSEEGLEEIINRRAAALVDRENKTEAELRELDKYIDMHVRLISSRHKHAEKMRQLELGGGTGATAGTGRSADREGDGAPAGEGQETPQRRGRRKRNNIDSISREDLQKFVDGLFGYQKKLRDAKHHRNRIWLKSRQIGATWYAAFEALEDAILTGNNQAFLSASRPQSLIFRRYIVKFAQQLFGLELTGDPIILSNGAELHFLSTNSSTAQGFCANIYIDEFLWQRNFRELKKVAGAIATHTYLRRTYISTPSAKTHQAYPFWTGDEWRKGSAKRENVAFPSFTDMQAGVMCPDNHWRLITTVEEAVRDMEVAAAAAGDPTLVLINIEEIQEENSASAFKQLYMCEFVDAGDAVFSFAQVERCLASVSTWQDHDPDAIRPFGQREVWAGYDPARSGDTACFVIVAPPQAGGEPFRVLRVDTWHGFNWKWQVERIKEYFERYRITHIGVDVTGIGGPVFEMVQEFARRQAVAIHYSVKSKNDLVLKMVDLVEHKRLAWDSEDRGIAASFMAIRHTTTNSGGSMTFVADRSAETGHADKFFAISHAVICEPLNNERKRKSGWARRLTGKINEQETALQKAAADAAGRAGKVRPKIQYCDHRHTNAGTYAGHAIPRNMVRRGRELLAPANRPARAGAAGQHVRGARLDTLRPREYGAVRLSWRRSQPNGVTAGGVGLVHVWRCSAAQSAQRLARRGRPGTAAGYVCAPA